MKSRNLKFLEPSEPLQSCNGTGYANAQSLAAESLWLYEWPPSYYGWTEMVWYDMIYDIWYDMILYMIWYDMIWYDIWYVIWYIWYDIWYDIYDMIYEMIWHDMIYMLTAVGLTPVGRSTVYIYTQTINRTTQLTNWEECGPCPVFASYTLAFSL
jgi:hypothetical protein